MTVWSCAALTAAAVSLGIGYRVRPHLDEPGRPLGGAGAAWFAVGAIVSGCVLLLDGRRLVLAIILLAAAAAAGRLVVHRRANAEADHRAELALAVCEGIAADLAAGQPPTRALERAVEDWPEFRAVASAATLGADVPAAIRELALRPGAAQLRTLAAAWQVAHRSGSGLAAATALAAESLRQQRATSRLLRTELASANATARMLAGLPLGVLLLGSGVGGDPIGFLLDSSAGLGCLATGLGLTWLGMIWLQRIAGQVLAR